MKGLWAIILLAVAIWGVIYYSNEMNSSPQKNQSVPENRYEPLIIEDSLLQFFSTPAYASSTSPTTPRTKGKADAPMTLYVMSSLSCGHCVHYHQSVLPSLEKKYIKTGKARLVYIDFPFDKRALSGAMLARCVPEEKFWDFLNLMFENQSKWAFVADATDVVTGYAKKYGLTKTDVDVCLSNTPLMKSIVGDRDSFMKKYQVTGTPTTVIIKGVKQRVVVGADLNAIEQAIEELAH